jgi:hypothetical protein
MHVYVSYVLRKNEAKQSKAKQIYCLLVWEKKERRVRAGSLIFIVAPYARGKNSKSNLACARGRKGGSWRERVDRSNLLVNPSRRQRGSRELI